MEGAPRPCRNHWERESGPFESLRTPLETAAGGLLDHRFVVQVGGAGRPAPVPKPGCKPKLERSILVFRPADWGPLTNIANALRGRPTLILTAALVGAAFLIPVASPSAETDPSDKPTAPNGPALPIEGIPQATRDAMDALASASAAARVSQQTWDDSRSLVQIHYVGSDAGLSAQVEKYLPRDSFELVRDRYYQSELSAESGRLAKAAIAAGIDISMASATDDNSGVQLAVRGPESSVSDADKAALRDLAKTSAYPVRVLFDGPTVGAAARLSD